MGSVCLTRMTMTRISSVILVLTAVLTVVSCGQWWPAVSHVGRQVRDVTHGARPSRHQSRRQGRSEAPDSYGAPEAPVSTPDLHNKEFCVDVSTYLPIEWEEKEVETCETVFVKQCEDKSEDVCKEVLETFCEVVPYTVCEMGLKPQEATSSKLAPKLFIEKSCTQGKKEIPHTKMVPECKNVTKQNCVTLWETDSNGKQVWAGNDACEPVTWQECNLVPKDVKFIVPEIKCEDKQELWYHEPEDVTETKMTPTFGCKVESTTHCQSQPRQDCKSISWKECSEVPVKNCEPKSVHIPMQEKQHRKKCLLHDEGQNSPAPASDSYGVPRAEPETSYSSQPVYKPQSSGYSG